MNIVISHFDRRPNQPDTVRGNFRVTVGETEARAISAFIPEDDFENWRYTLDIDPALGVVIGAAPAFEGKRNPMGLAMSMHAAKPQDGQKRYKIDFIIPNRDDVPPLVLPNFYGQPVQGARIDSDARELHFTFTHSRYRPDPWYLKARQAQATLLPTPVREEEIETLPEITRPAPIDINTVIDAMNLLNTAPDAYRAAVGFLFRLPEGVRIEMDQQFRFKLVIE